MRDWVSGIRVGLYWSVGAMWLFGSLKKRRGVVGDSCRVVLRNWCGVCAVEVNVNVRSVWRWDLVRRVLVEEVRRVKEVRLCGLISSHEKEV